MKRIVYLTNTSEIAQSNVSLSKATICCQKLALQDALNIVKTSQPEDDSWSLFLLCATDMRSTMQIKAILECCAEPASTWGRSSYFIVSIQSRDNAARPLDGVIPANWNHWGRLRVVFADGTASDDAVSEWINASSLQTFNWARSKCSDDFAGSSVVWLCNFNDTTIEARLNALKSVHCDALEVPMKREVLRYSLANCTVPDRFRALLFIHRTEWAVDVLISDIEQMDVSTVKKLVFCLYTGAGSSKLELEKLRKCLSTREGHCLELSGPPDNCYQKELAQIVYVYRNDCTSGGDEWLLVKTLERAADHAGRTELLALSILCQGYLVVHNPETFDLDDKIQEKFRKDDAVRKVDDPWWWMEAFGDYSDKSEAAMIASVKELEKSVASEWKGSMESRKPIDDLLKAFLGKAQLADTVRPAWTAIRDHLESLNPSAA